MRLSRKHVAAATLTATLLSALSIPALVFAQDPTAVAPVAQQGMVPISLLYWLIGAAGAVGGVGTGVVRELWKRMGELQDKLEKLETEHRGEIKQLWEKNLETTQRVMEVVQSMLATMDNASKVTDRASAVLEDLADQIEE